VLAADQAALFSLPGLNSIDPLPDTAVAAHRDSLARVAAAYPPLPDEDALYHEPASVANAVRAPSSDHGASTSATVASGDRACGSASDQVGPDPEAVAANSHPVAHADRDTFIAVSDSLSEQSVTPQVPAEASASVTTVRRPVRRSQKGARPGTRRII